ncbi:MAG: HIT family protein, partial [Desulfosporosinus sp.]|nr:HIT family protein [Desulfosporosinus sp.]
VNEGHVLIVPKRHVVSLFDATQEEITSIWKLIEGVKELLDQRFHSNGYNIGVNVGAAAGQTIFHMHVHVIPRYDGDVEDPRGGIRKIKKSLVPYVGEGEE